MDKDRETNEGWMFSSEDGKPTPSPIFATELDCWAYKLKSLRTFAEKQCRREQLEKRGEKPILIRLIEIAEEDRDGWAMKDWNGHIWATSAASSSWQAWTNYADVEAMSYPEAVRHIEMFQEKGFQVVPVKIEVVGQ